MKKMKKVSKLTTSQKKAIFAKMRQQNVLYAHKRYVRVSPDGKVLDIAKDRKRKALPVGKRISEDGNVYYERRANRSDVNDYDRRRKFATRKKEWL